MVTPNQCLWAKYGTYEGPWVRGTRGMKLPLNPTEDDRRAYVLSSTEGKYDSVNFYDSCICSVGSLQLCEKFYLVSNLLGYVVKQCGENVVLSALKPALDASNATFKLNRGGAWRFFFNDIRGEVNSLALQQELFLKCDGKIGSWTPEAKDHAKLWAACMANVFQTDATCLAQIDYVKSKLTSFVLKSAKNELWDGTSDEGVNGAVRAAYISFAANNPTRASEALTAHVKETTSQKWSEDWLIELLQKMTFLSGVKIYPIRYNAIRGPLEQLWNVSLPKSAEDLKTWSKAPDPVVPQVLPTPPEVTPTPVQDPPVTVQSDDVIKPIEPQPVPETHPDVTQEKKETVVYQQPSLFTFILNLFKSLLLLFKSPIK